MKTDDIQRTTFSYSGVLKKCVNPSKFRDLVLKMLSRVAVSTATKPQAQQIWNRVLIPSRTEFFTSLLGFKPALGPNQPPRQCVLGALPPEVERPGHEADHSLQFSAEAKKA
jgi:hypothetical protein